LFTFNIINTLSFEYNLRFFVKIQSRLSKSNAFSFKKASTPLSLQEKSSIAAL